MSSLLPDFDTPPFRLSGTVVGALLNHAPQWVALGDAAHRAPYKAPAQGPVLAVKPRHMLACDGQAIGVPAGAPGLVVGAGLAIVIGRVACGVTAGRALSHVAGYSIAAEFSVAEAEGGPAASASGAPAGAALHYRPGVRLKARDGHCLIGPRVVAAADVPAPDALAVQVWLDGVCVQATDTADRVRGVARLIADVSDFMTLQPGDVLLLGTAQGAPVARAGQAVAIGIEGLGRLTGRLVIEAGAA